LQRWLDAGGATKDPILALVDRWWGEKRLTDFLAWAARSDALLQLVHRLAQTRHAENISTARVTDRRSYEAARNEGGWQATWSGGTDPLHLVEHALSPVDVSGGKLGHRGFQFFDAREVDERNPAAIPRFHVSFDYYQAWYFNLLHYMPTKGANGRSVRTELVCRPVGWLGEFRHCARTNTFFRGRTGTHLLGN
jgi:hypothetical protein